MFCAGPAAMQARDPAAPRNTGLDTVDARGQQDPPRDRDDRERRMSGKDFTSEQELRSQGAGKPACRPLPRRLDSVDKLDDGPASP